MARIFGWLVAERDAHARFRRHWSLVRAYYATMVADQTLAEEVRMSPCGQFAVAALWRPDERPPLLTDPATGTLSVVDGTPVRGDARIDPAAITNALKTPGADINHDGAWITLAHAPESGILYLARDRFGIKPFFLAPISAGWVFASQPGALIRSGLVSAEMNLNRVARYAASNYRVVFGGTNTFFDRIEQIPPAAVTALHLGPFAKKSVTPYWCFDPDAPYFDEPDAELEERYRETIAGTIRSVVKTRNATIGTTLSGGIDSGTLAGLLHRVTGRKCPAFTLCYDDTTDFDESQLVRHSVAMNAEPWTSATLRATDLKADLESLYGPFDQPLCTVSAYGYEYLYRVIAATNTRTILSGGLGDVIQGGNFPAIMVYLAELRASGRDADYRRELAAWIRLYGTQAHPKSEKVFDEFYAKAISERDGRKHIVSYDLPLADGLLDRDFAREAGPLGLRTLGNLGSLCRTHAAHEYYFETLAPLAEPEDIMEWRHGIDVISPYLFDAICQMGWCLPPNQKIQDGINKVLARRALRGITPDPVLDQIVKTGFNAPLDLWLRGSLKEPFMDIVGSRAFRERGIYDIRTLDHLIAEHMSGSANHMMVLWQAMNLELWCQAWLTPMAQASATRVPG